LPYYNHAIQYMSNEIKNNFKICKIAVLKNADTLQYISDEMQNNFEVCKIAAAQNGMVIRYMNNVSKRKSKPKK
jgi:hypothetical protein